MDVSYAGYIDLRLVAPAGEKSWLDGGLGKFRFGAGQPSPNLRFTEAALQVMLAVNDDVHAVTTLRLEPEQRTGIDILESYIAWRPSASGDWRWSAKAGAFFPPVSEENDDLGWTSPYTLTPSAINSWVGEELRTIGGEATLARGVGGAGTLSATASLFCCNEPAGTVMAERGWALDDRPTGLFERLRLPDATVHLYGGTPPGRTGLFENVAGDVGWYGQLKWDMPGIGQVAVLRYDNKADPNAATSRDAAWLTRFWNVSLKTRLGGVALLAQAFTGDTAIGNGAGGLATTYFDSAFLLASYDIGDWRLSARAEAFDSRTAHFALMDEDGHAFTAAAIWNARDWLRLTAEALTIDSRRNERVLEGLATHGVDTQLQLSARAFL